MISSDSFPLKKHQYHPIWETYLWLLCHYYSVAVIVSDCIAINQM